MIVTMQHRGHSITGLRIGRRNARRYFPIGMRSIDFELDHLHIRCELRADFWFGQAEISDRRLSTWLERKLFWKDDPHDRVQLDMVKSGESYRLHLLHSPASPHSTVPFR